MGWNQSIIKKEKKKRLFHFEQLDIETGKLKSNLGGVDVEKEMKKSVLIPGLEKEHRLPKYDVSDRKLRAMRKVSSNTFLSIIIFIYMNVFTHLIFVCPTYMVCISIKCSQLY